MLYCGHFYRLIQHLERAVLFAIAHGQDLAHNVRCFSECQPIPHRAALAAYAIDHMPDVFLFLHVADQPRGLDAKSHQEGCQ